MLSRFAGEALAYIEWFINGLPGRSGVLVREWFYRRRFAELGAHTTLGQGLLIFAPDNINIGTNFSCWRLCVLAAADGGRITIGNRVSFSANVHLNASVGGHIILGDDIMIGPNVVIRASDHATALVDKPMNTQGHVSDRIFIEDDVWVAANATIVGGVRIGRGSVVAAGAVVTADVQPYSVVGGVPARLIKKRGADLAHLPNDVAERK